MLAWIFRTLNAKIITTQFEFVRKPLKVVLLISQQFVKGSAQQLHGKHTWVIINNFDGNIKLKIDRSRMMGASFFWTGIHELREFIFLHRFLRPDMVAMDVGANLGEYTVFMAKRLARGRVFSFEPMKSIRDLLVENINLNGFSNVQVFDYGVSDRKQTLNFHEIDDGNEGLGTFYPGLKKSTKHEEILLKPLDEEFSSLRFDRVDFIKIDIEGGELFALKGAAVTIRKYRPLVMVEVSEENYKAAGYATSDVAAFFGRENYKPYTVNKKGDLVECSEMPPFGNVFFKPQ